ncbi:MAG TPA: heme o synthase, partial [Methylomirabilota bacterium]|nr:heme o synthase [Methylomirabilota bacterium]
MTSLFRLALFSALGVYALIVLGGITGQLHRSMAALVGALILAVAVGTLRVAGVQRRTKMAAWVAVALVVAQAVLGAVTAWREAPAGFVAGHLGAAMLCFGSVILALYYVALDRGAPAWIVRAGWGHEAGVAADDGALRDLTFLRIAQVGAVATLLLIVSGGLTATAGASLACDSWPLCLDARIVPDRASDDAWVNLGHRSIAVVGGVVLAVVAVTAHRRRADPAARRLALAAGAVFGIEVLIGAAYVWTGGAGWISATHLAAAALVWGLMLGVAIVAGRAWESGDGFAGAPVHRPSPAGPAFAAARGVAVGLVQRGAAVRDEPDERRDGPRLAAQMSSTGAATLAPAYPFGPTPFILIWPDVRRWRAVVADYVALTKPGIMSLLLVTTLGAMLVAAEGFPSFWLVLATLAGGTLAAGGANALNCYIDRDIDALMPRTRRRGTANGRISPRAALIFGVALSVLAVVELGVLVNWPAAGLALAGNLFYVFVYTLWLKRATPHNIVIGGAAGAVPPLVGWAAVTGDLGWAPWLMFATIFMWTPPHFWALALLKQGEYGRAAVPMLPVVAGEAATRRQIVLYTVLLIPVTLALGLVGLSWIYLAAALALNAVFLAFALRLWWMPSKRLARRT